MSAISEGTQADRITELLEQVADLHGQVDGLKRAIHELQRTRSEAEAVATVQGYRDGQAAVVSQLRAQKLIIELKH